MRRPALALASALLALTFLGACSADDGNGPVNPDAPPAPETKEGVTFTDLPPPAGVFRIKLPYPYPDLIRWCEGSDLYTLTQVYKHGGGSVAVAHGVCGPVAVDQIPTTTTTPPPGG